MAQEIELKHSEMTQKVREMVASIPEEQKALFFSLLSQGQSLDVKVQYANPLDFTQIITTIPVNGKERVINTYKLAQDFIEENIDRLHNESKLTYIHGLNCLFEYLEEKGITNPTELDLKKWVYFIENEKPITTPTGKIKKNGLNAPTVHSYLISCKRFFKWTEKKGLFPNIATDVRARAIQSLYGKKEALSDEDARELINHIGQDKKNDIRNRLIVALELYCGLRDIEISRMTYGDISLKTRTILIHGKGQQKGGKERLVGIAPKLEKILKDYFKIRGNMADNDLLFIGFGNKNKGEGLPAKSIGRIVKTELEKIGLTGQKFTAHSLRHTFATDLLEDGIDIKNVQLCMGHADMKTTAIYDERSKKANLECFNRIAERI